MGLFDTKWIVEYEFSEGFLSSYKKGTIVVEASSEYDAKSKAKSVLKGQYSFVKVSSAHKSGGKSEENKATFEPKVTVIEKPRDNNYQGNSLPRKELTPEDRELLREQYRRREAVKKQQEKLRKVELKAKAVKRASIYHIRMAILAGILSIAAFLLSWIPYIVLYLPAIVGRSELSLWIELGHNETDEYAIELKEGIAKATEESNKVLWVPFAIIAIGIIITMAVLFLSRRKTQSKVDKASEELKTIVREYENEYGEIGKQVEKSWLDKKY